MAAAGRRAGSEPLFTPCTCLSDHLLPYVALCLDQLIRVFSAELTAGSGGGCPMTASKAFVESVRALLLLLRVMPGKESQRKSQRKSWRTPRS